MAADPLSLESSAHGFVWSVRDNGSLTTLHSHVYNKNYFKILVPNIHRGEINLDRLIERFVDIRK